jgi:enoyl-[acyl-carrier protein] reductase III
MTILIAGGTKGIGLAIAKAFAEDAGDVILGYHSDAVAAAMAAEAVTKAGGRPHLVKADAGTPEGRAAMATAARAVAGRLDQVVHCATERRARKLLDRVGLKIDPWTF